jgi:hypothetical protein
VTERRIGLWVALALLVAADAYSGLVIVNAASRSGGYGAVFWAAVGLLVICSSPCSR